MSKESKLSLNIEEETEGSYDDSQIKEETRSYAERKRVPFSTTLNAGLYEKLKAIHFYEDIRISDVINQAVERAVNELEDRKGESYSIPEPLKIDE